MCFWAAMAALAPLPAEAQDAADDPAAVQPGPTLDVADLWYRLRHKDEPPQADTAVPLDPQRRFLVFVPAIGSRPSTGFTLGVNGNVAFFRGDAKSTHISSMVGGLRFSQKKQVLLNARFSVFTENDRWFLQGDNRLNWTSLDTFGLGSDSGTAGTANLKFNFFRFNEAVYRTVKPGLFVGAGVNVNVRSNIRAGQNETGFDRSAYFAYTKQHGFAVDEQVSNGTNLGLLFDTRDNAINAARGWLASAAYHTYFKGFVGGDATWQQLSLDVRTYRPLTASGSHRLAIWLMSDLVTGGVAPYLDLPTTGGDARSGRGYTEGRYRGDRLVYGEVEYRGTLMRSGLLGFVAFVNTSTIGSTETGLALFDSYAPAAGVGLRVLLNKRSRTNLTSDWAWGKQGSRGFYLGIQEAF
jgi:outer membrane protein assembly factor BamA